jgi:glycosyltransferase involved in cell wall biosynthesis
MKILFDATPMIVERTGIAYYTERVVTHMARLYPDIELVGFYYNFLGRRDTSHLPTLPNLRYIGASLVPSKVVFQLRRWGIEVPVELLALQKADFVWYPNFIGYPTLTGIPSSIVVHDMTYHDLPEYVSAKLRSDLTRFVPELIKRAHFVTTVSNFTKQRLIDVYDVPADAIITTPIPPAPAVKHTPSAIQQALKGMGISKPYVLFVGTIEPRKNVPNLIEAFLSLPADVQRKHQLVIVGRIGWNCEREVAALQAAKDAGANVIHLGYVTDEAKDILYQSATVFSTASHYEGFGMPILEAMNYGIPCAVSDIQVFREVAGKGALFFDQDQPASIAKTLQELLGNPKTRQQLSVAGSKQLDTYSWDSVARTLYQAISVAAGKN